MIVKIKEGGEAFYFNAESIEDAINKHIEMYENEITKSDIDEAVEITNEQASRLQSIDEDGNIVSLLEESKSTFAANSLFGLIASTIY